MSEPVSRRSLGHVACLILLALPAAAWGGIGPNGFFDEYLVLGPYSDPDGDNAGDLKQAEDYLCDGQTTENTISPIQGLVLGHPLTGTCAGASNTGYLGPGDPTIGSAVTTGDLLDLLTRYTPNTMVMAYAWVYVENTTGDKLLLTLALASDDGVQVKLNGEAVFNISAPLWYDAPGHIHDRFRVDLLPGMNLIQFKVFQGAGYWGLRARFENPATSSPILDGDPRLWVGITGHGIHGLGGTRRIAPDGTRAADISIEVEDGGTVYTLREKFGPGWSVASSTGNAAVSDQMITWSDAVDATLSYRLVRSRPFTREEGWITGTLSSGDSLFVIAGDDRIPGFSPGFVGEFLLSPPFTLSEGDGCGIPQSAMEGAWIGDGQGLNDEDVVPREGLEFRPDFGGPGSQASGLSPIGDSARSIFWTIPSDPSRSKVRLARLASDVDGTFSFTSAYGGAPGNCVNVAYSFVMNDTGQDRFAVNLGLGSDDSAAVRVNGFPIWSHQACRPVQSFEDKLPVSLRAGKNLIAVYTFNGGGDYGLDVRFEDREGIPLALETTLDPEGYQGVPPPPACAAAILQTGRRWVGVTLDHTIALKGGEMGIAYEPGTVTPFVVRPGRDLPPGVLFEVQRAPGNQCAPGEGVSAGLTAAWILPGSAPLLPPGKHEVLKILFTPVPGVPLGTCSPLRFVTCLGVAGAPVSNVVTDPGSNTVEMVVKDGQVCLLEEPPFRRGDANGDARFDISDPIAILGCLFQNESCPTCTDASDADDSGRIDITDAIFLLSWRFINGPPPPPPFPACGLDPAIDELPDCLGGSCQ